MATVMGQTEASTLDEVPAWFDAAGNTLFGVFTRSTVDPLGVTVLMVPTGGVPLGTGRNRWQVHLARRLAADGYHSFRFDYHGAGESTGHIAEWRLDRPFKDDVLGAVRWLESHGLNRIVVVAACFGTRSALWAAAEIRGLEGVHLTLIQSRDWDRDDTVPVRVAESRGLKWYASQAISPRVLRGLTDPKRRRIYARLLKVKARTLVRGRLASLGRGSDASAMFGISPHFLDPLEGVLQRGIPVTLLYGTDDDDYRDYLQGCRGRLGQVARRAGPLLSVVTLDGSIGAMSAVGVQREVVDIFRNRIGQQSPAAVG